MVPTAELPGKISYIFFPGGMYGEKRQMKKVTPLSIYLKYTVQLHGFSPCRRDPANPLIKNICPREA